MESLSEIPTGLLPSKRRDQLENASVLKSQLSLNSPDKRTVALGREDVSAKHCN